MTETQTESSNNSQQALSSPIRVETNLRTPASSRESEGSNQCGSARRSLLAGVGYGVYRLFFISQSLTAYF